MKKKKQRTGVPAYMYLLPALRSEYVRLQSEIERVESEITRLKAIYGGGTYVAGVMSSNPRYV